MVMELVFNSLGSYWRQICLFMLVVVCYL